MRANLSVISSSQIVTILKENIVEVLLGLLLFDVSLK